MKIEFLKSGENAFSTLSDLRISALFTSRQSDRAGSQGWTVLGPVELSDCSSSGEPPRTSSVSCPWKPPPSPCPCRLTYGQTEPPAQGLVDFLGLKNLENSFPWYPGLLRLRFPHSAFLYRSHPNYPRQHSLRGGLARVQITLAGEG